MKIAILLNDTMNAVVVRDINHKHADAIQTGASEAEEVASVMMEELHAEGADWMVCEDSELVISIEREAIAALVEFAQTYAEEVYGEESEASDLNAENLLAQAAKVKATFNL